MRGKAIYDSYYRSAGQTVKMSPQEVKQMIAESQGLQFHEQIALTKASADDVLKLLDYNSYFQLTKRNFPESKTTILEILEDAQMTNQSFRERMGINEKNYSMISRIIKETINFGLIKEFAPENQSRKYKSYIPYWG